MNPLEELGLIMIKIMQNEEMYIDLEHGCFDGHIQLSDSEIAILEDARGDQG